MCFVSSRTLAALAAVLVLGAAGSAGAQVGVIPLRENLLENGGFERGSRGWTAFAGARRTTVGAPARQGTASLAVTLRRGRGGGVLAAVEPEALAAAGLVSPVTATLQGTLRATAWIRASPRSVGRLVRVQLNETGGAFDQEELGDAVVERRLTRAWQRVAVLGSVRRLDRTGVVALVSVPRARAGDVVYVDDFRVAGEPPDRVPVNATEERWSPWAYAAVWAAVLGAGALTLLLRRKPNPRARRSGNRRTPPRT